MVCLSVSIIRLLELTLRSNFHNILRRPMMCNRILGALTIYRRVFRFSRYSQPVAMKHKLLLTATHRLLYFTLLTDSPAVVASWCSYKTRARWCVHKAATATFEVAAGGLQSDRALSLDECGRLLTGVRGSLAAAISRQQTRHTATLLRADVA